MPKATAVFHLAQYLPYGREDKPGNWADLSRWGTPEDAWERIDVFRQAYDDHPEALQPAGYRVVRRTIIDEVVPDLRPKPEPEEEADAVATGLPGYPGPGPRPVDAGCRPGLGLHRLRHPGPGVHPAGRQDLGAAVRLRQLHAGRLEHLPHDPPPAGPVLAGLEAVTLKQLGTYAAVAFVIWLIIVEPVTAAKVVHGIGNLLSEFAHGVTAF